jgi:hypothetical protein
MWSLILKLMTNELKTLIIGFQKKGSDSPLLKQ